MFDMNSFIGTEVISFDVIYKNIGQIGIGLKNLWV